MFDILLTKVVAPLNAGQMSLTLATNMTNTLVSVVTQPPTWQGIMQKSARQEGHSQKQEYLEERQGSDAMTHVGGRLLNEKSVQMT